MSDGLMELVRENRNLLITVEALKEEVARLSVMRDQDLSDAVATSQFKVVSAYFDLTMAKYDPRQMRRAMEMELSRTLLDHAEQLAVRSSLSESAPLYGHSLVWHFLVRKVK